MVRSTESETPENWVVLGVGSLEEIVDLTELDT